MNKGTLYIVATPIGNMGDITKRAVETLSTVDFVACEDTRVAGGLLHQLNIKKELVSIHQHSSEEKIGHIIRELETGKSVAYVSDNGTPGISDPGQKLVKAIQQYSNLTILPVPGPSAVTAAISVSGLVEKEFYFVGFLPKKKGRETKFKWLKLLDCSIVIYESAQRLEKTLLDIKKFLGDNTEVFIAREMTKKFEENWGGNIVEIINDLKSHTIKGEFVLIVRK
ncbi:MAG: 16S rRNA (cytidine(1402)-2'-O)-methyltransferase [Candidatus Berkelbacteria bacterium]|nr:16S rRNA (cytidine(1402)-2'-O)-methyltransferase [Candidatus Berkelbacteria bacterium]